MIFIEILLGALAYIIPTFPLAYFWHLKFFKSKYEKWQYFGSPSPMLGLLSMIVQGIVLSYLYFTINSPQLTIPALAFAGAMGIFHWSIHVIAAMAKQKESRNLEFFVMETLYLAIQFGIFGMLLGKV